MSAAVQLCAARARFHRHPLVEGILTLPVSSPAFREIRDSIVADGIREPLKCVRDGDRLLVLDGLHRLAIASELKIPELPYVEVPPSEALCAICSSLMRADWPKSALAYRMWPLFESCCFKKGGDRKSKGNHFPLISTADIAKKMCVSEKLIKQARSIHAYFVKHPEAREEQEDLILLGKLPLHKAGPNGGKKESAIPIQKIETSLRRLPKQFQKWDEICHADKERAKNQLSTCLHQLPQDVQVTAYEPLEIAIGKL